MTIGSILLLGSGNHAEVVVAALQACGKSAVGCLGPAPPKKNWTNEVAYLGKDDHLKTLNPNDWELINCIGSIKDTALRAQVFLRAISLGFDFATLIHPSAVIASDLLMGQGSQLHAGVVVQPGVSLGENVLINTGSVVDHGTQIADHAHIASGAVVAGNVLIGPRVHLGVGAVVKQGIKIGENSIIGAGAVVIEDVPANACFVGNPAHAIPSKK
jgi:UDP-perosamine 4-acetyltransferase